jgi:high affinity sulfate transporter 1
MAGVTVAAYLIPQVMACAQLAGLPLAAGLWSALVASLVYVVLGSAPLVSMGPESTTALMTAAALGSVAVGAEHRPARAALLALLMGAVCLAARLIRLGFLADLLSKPVLIGYMCGVAMLMSAAQLGPMTRTSGSGDSFAADLRGFGEHLGQTHLPTVALAVAVLAILIVGRRRPRVPVPLLAVLGAAAAVWLFQLRHHGVAVVGHIPLGPPSLGLSDLSLTDAHTLLLPAIGLAVVGYSDNILTARAFASDGAVVDGNRELLALGSANVGTALVGGFPVSSSATRTALGLATGGRTRWCPVITAIAVLFALLTIRQVLAFIPQAALGAVVVFAAGHLIDLDELRRLGHFRRSELGLALVAAGGVLALGVLPGIGVAVALSGLDLARRVARPHDAVLGFVPGLAGMHDVTDYPDAGEIPGLVVYRYDAPLCFANAADFRRRALAAADAAGHVEWFVLNAEAVVEADITALDALDEVHAALGERGAVFAMARVKQDLRERLAATGLLERIGADRVYPTLPTAVEGFVAWYRAHHGGNPDLPAEAPTVVLPRMTDGASDVMYRA